MHAAVCVCVIARSVFLEAMPVFLPGHRDMTSFRGVGFAKNTKRGYLAVPLRGYVGCFWSMGGTAEDLPSESDDDLVNA